MTTMELLKRARGAKNAVALASTQQKNAALTAEISQKLLRGKEVKL